MADIMADRMEDRMERGEIEKAAGRIDQRGDVVSNRTGMKMESSSTILPQVAGSINLN